MTETAPVYQSIDAAPSQCVPFHMLSSRQREVLQYTSDGLTTSQIAKLMIVSVDTAKRHKRNIAHIGINGASSVQLPNEYDDQTYLTVLALIQDGILNGYLTHDLPEKPVKPLTDREHEVVELVAQGKSDGEIAQQLYIETGSVKSHLNNIRKKLHAKNKLHAVARSTYLTTYNLWPTA